MLVPDDDVDNDLLALSKRQRLLFPLNCGIQFQALPKRKQKTKKLWCAMHFGTIKASNMAYDV